MITVRKVFIQRVISEWKYQYEVWKTVVDWIVVLYIVIPFLYIFIETYLSWWRACLPLSISFPWIGIWGIILIFAWSGTLRLFIEEADQLFLFQQRRWFKRLIRYSLAYPLSYSNCADAGWNRCIFVVAG